jgi:hypothetical protein
MLTRASYPTARTSALAGDGEFRIHVFGLPPDPSTALSIGEYGPTEATACLLFKQPPADSSTLWFKTQNANPGMVLVVNAEEHEVDYRSPEYVTARIPCESLRDGPVALYLFDPVTQRRSNAVQFDLRPNFAPVRR